MILASPGETHTFVPASEQKKPAERQVSYQLRVPGVWDKMKFRAALGQHNVRQYGLVALLDALERGVKAIYGDRDSEAKQIHLQAIADYRAEARQLGEALMSGEIDIQTDAGQERFNESMARQNEYEQGLAEVAQLVAQGYPPYATMRAANSAYALGRGLVAAQMFLLGWENLPGDVSRGPDGVPDAVLARIPEHHLQGIGAEIERLFEPTEDEAKNSGSPSSTGSSPKASTAASTNSRDRNRKTTRGGESPSCESPNSESTPATC